MSDALTDVQHAVLRLGAEQDALLEACTDPQATDMAELLDSIRTAREALQAIERDVEYACAKAMLGDQALTATLRVERYRSTDRKAWDHESWQREVRRKAVQAAGLKGAQIVNPAGELLSPDVIYDLLAAVQQAHGSTAPRTTALRGLGLDPADYCETSRGAWHVKVQRMADETENTDTEAGAA